VALVVIRVEVIESGEITLLPRNHLRGAIAKLSQRPDAGKPLTRKLKGCRSLRVGAFRIVYRLRENGTVVEILAIGQRRDDEAYGTAGPRV
jgi:mRNA-degrading endonuclease RelE of RelBE toxin-antitoxin system